MLTPGFFFELRLWWMLVEPTPPPHFHHTQKMASPSRQQQQTQQRPHSPQQIYHRQQPPPPSPNGPNNSGQPQNGGMTYHQQPQPQPGFWPPQPEMYVVPELHGRVINQVHYYFSPENLHRDDFLRSQMDPNEGWVNIQLLATFRALQRLTTDVHLIAEVSDRRRAPALLHA